MRAVNTGGSAGVTSVVTCGRRRHRSLSPVAGLATDPVA